MSKFKRRFEVTMGLMAPEWISLTNPRRQVSRSSTLQRRGAEETNPLAGDFSGGARRPSVRIGE
jgi:hypothetical protein